MEATYQIKLADDAANYYGRLSEDKRGLVDIKLELIAREPFHGKPLRHHLKGLRSIRLGPLRLVYRVNLEKQEIVVVELTTRDKVYKRVGR